MKYTDICSGLMTTEQIGKEIAHYLNSYKQPSKLLVSIERDGDKFYTKIYMLADDFTKNVIHL